MLNKIWAGLILLGILFALGQDVRDEIQNTHKNGIAQVVSYTSAASHTSAASYARAEQSNTNIILIFKQSNLNATINTDGSLYIHLDKQSPEHLRNIAQIQGNESRLAAKIQSKNTNQLTLLLPEIHWLKLRAVTNAAFDIAKFAVQLAIGLIGIMALWLGLMQIAEKSGLIQLMVKFVQPLLHWLFPNIPKDHPVFGSISMNMAANVLGLGNAATPLGIKAMQQLQSLNKNKDNASDEMCMFLALNTSSVQLLPPVTLIALMGTQVSELIAPIILATSCSTITAVIVAKIYAHKNSVDTSCNS